MIAGLIWVLAGVLVGLYFSGLIGFICVIVGLALMISATVRQRA